MLICSVCDGKSGAVSGNSQFVDGKLMCDYCYSDFLKITPSNAQLMFNYPCNICWTNSWVPTGNNNECSLNHIHGKNCARCDMCWLTKIFAEYKTIHDEIAKFVINLSSKRIDYGKAVSCKICWPAYCKPDCITVLASNLLWKLHVK